MAAQKKTPEEVTRPLNEAEEIFAQKSSFPKKDTISPGNANALLDAVAAISAPLELRQVAEEAARQIVRFSKADVCAVSRWDAEEDRISLWAEYLRGQEEHLQIPYLSYRASDYPVTQNVLKAANPVQLRLNDPTLDEGERIFMKGMGAKSMLMVPLVAHDQTIGLIELFEVAQDRAFTDEEIINIQVLAKHAGISLERARLLSEAKQRAIELEIIRQASLNLTASLEKERVYNAILESALQLSPYALDAHIFTYQDGEFFYAASKWANGKKGPVWKNVRPGGLTATVASEGKIIAVERVDTHPLYKNTEWVKEGWKGSIIGLPLKAGPQLVGVMNIAYKTRQKFTEDRLRVLGLLGDQAAIAIMNARLHDLVKHQATTDPLTALANRRAFNEQLEDEIRRSNRYHHPFVLLFLDLDGFKEVNDNFGHPTGDLTLQKVADCLLNSIRDTDFLARYGGDEFAMILPETKKTQAHSLVAKIHETLKQCEMPWTKSGNLQRVSVSVGIASFPDEAGDSQSLIASADADLYRSKNK
ncbi:MAG: diguanylate cyclase [candidate division Zixibacteria bacterium]|nr:diguanylate cyclase [Gammaproteobacteria bacterium]NIX56783.1 diguanylate cyclase [candidate division Zixibacteria bacterium]